MCFRVDSTAGPVGPVGDGCCKGAQCQPYIATGETATTPADWYCQYIDTIALGGKCVSIMFPMPGIVADNLVTQGSKEGKCATGLDCISGLCTVMSITFERRGALMPHTE